MKITQKIELIADIIKEFIEEENIDDHPNEGFLVSDESWSNDPNSDTDKDSVTSTQHTYWNRDAGYAAEVINNDDKSVTSINEKYGIETIHKVDYISEMFPEEENYKCLRGYP